MSAPDPLRETLLQYMMNELGEAEREEVDTFLIADPEYHAAFQEAEYDLLDAYAAGELSETDRRRVEIALRPQERVSFGKPERGASANVVAMPPVVGKRVPVWMGAAAALAIAGVLGGVGIARYRAAHGRSAEVAGKVVPTADGPVKDAPQVQGEAAIPNGPQGPHGKAATGHTQAVSAPMAMLLLPGTMRSQGGLTLRIAKGMAQVAIEWPAPVDAARGARYRAEVVTDAGDVACTSQGTTKGRVVRFVCKAERVPVGVDFVRVVGVPADTDTAPLFEATVSVSKAE